MKTKFLTLATLAILGLSAMIQNASGQLGLTLSGTSYTQNFDNLGDGILADGWYLYTNATQFSIGTLAGWSEVNYNPSSNYWANTSGRFGNHAAVGTLAGNETNDVQAAAADRALGIRQTGSFGDPGAAFALKLANTLGFGSFSLNVDLMQLSPQDRETTWTIDYALGDTPGFFIPVAKYTNSAAVFSKSNLTFSFGSALNNQSSAVWIRIVAITGSTGSGNRDTFAIDNFALAYSADTGITPITITIDPVNRTNNVGTTVYFNVGASGTDPQYQWRKGTTDLANDGHYNGVNTATLQILNLTTADAGSYSCRVSNGAGSQTSQAATLTVPDLSAQNPSPLSKSLIIGDAINILLNLNGTPPITVQWRKNGVDIPGAVTNFAAAPYAARYLAASDSEGTFSYDAMISNGSGNLVSAASVMTVVGMPANRIARWDFNVTTPGTSPATSFGSGTAVLIGGTTVSSGGGDFADPASLVAGLNNGWNTTTYPAQGANNKTAGVQFNVSTVGQKDIKVAWQERHSNTASKYQRFQYSTDGTTFVDGPQIEYTVTDNSFVFYSVDLSAVAGVNNNSSFAFRLVTELSGSSYVATTSYGVTGTIRYDLVTVAGNTFTSQPDSIPLNIQKNGDGTVTLTWSNPVFKLQERASLTTGDWATLESATSGYTVSASGVKFYRLIAP